MKILITGASGMVGRNLVEHAGLAAHDILTPSRNQLDLLNYAQVSEYLSGHRPDFIVHCAGKVGGIQANLDNPVGYLVDNLDMGRNLVLAASNFGVPQLLNLGSSCMYPKNASDAISESSLLSGPLEPSNEGYALAKIVVARLCEYISRTEKHLSYKTAIPCNVYGRYDSFDPESSHFLAATILKIHRALKDELGNVEIWGSGNARRELIFAADLADFIVYAMDNFATMPALLNVGTGVDHSINEYYSITAGIMGYKGGFTHDRTRQDGMQRKLTDISRLQEYGWHAGTSLEDGIRVTCDYYLEEQNDGE